LAVTVPAVAWKVAVVAPAATATEAGTVSAALLSERLTVVPPVGAALDIATVQVDLPPEAMLVGEHASELNVGGAVPAAARSESEALTEELFKVAVTVTAWFELSETAVAVKLAVVEPEETTTEAGTVREELLSDSETVSPPEGAAPLRVVVQVELPGVVTEVGEQARPVKVGTGGGVPTTEMDEPDPVTVAVVPSPFAPPTPELPIATEEPLTVCASVAFTTPTTPLGMELELLPEATHLTEPLAVAQVIVFPAELNAAPAVTLREAMPLGYVSVHCSAAGAVPDGVFSERFNDVEPPCGAEPEARLKLVWLNAEAPNPRRSRNRPTFCFGE
jgi:hypothetical protein